MTDFMPAFGAILFAVAALFTPGVLPRFAPRFYPGNPALGRRLAAPLLFAALGAACFTGAGPGAMIAAAMLGTTQAGIARWRLAAAPA